MQRTLLLLATLSLSACAEVVPPEDFQSLATVPHWVETDDGHWVHLLRYANEGMPPVVLVHGISSNHHFWDLQPDRSLALYLHHAGYDVWNMDLRGHGDAVLGPDGQRQPAGWTVDDYGRYDLPAAFAYVQELTGESQLRYVGHSMGGMVLAIYLASHATTPLVSAVAVASPLDFRDPDAMTKAALGSAWLGTGVGFLPTPLGGRLLAHLDTRTPLSLDEMLYNPANMTPEARKLMLRRIVSPLSKGELAQFGLASLGEFRSADGDLVYRSALGQVSVPMLFIAGRADRVASPERVWAYYDAVGSPDKGFIVASVANGFSGDYGHLDIGLGDEARTEIYPLIEAWLDGER